MPCSSLLLQIQTFVLPILLCWLVCYATLVDVEWDLAAILAYISFMMNDIEHLFFNLLAICRPSFMGTIQVLHAF